MPKYLIDFEEVRKTTLVVEADDEQAAWDLACDAYEDGKVRLDDIHYKPGLSGPVEGKQPVEVRPGDEEIFDTLDAFIERQRWHPSSRLKVEECRYRPRSRRFDEGPEGGNASCFLPFS